MAFGETYPNRSGVPQSQVVPYAQSPAEWGQDWSNRYMNEDAKGPGISFDQLLWNQVNGYANDSKVDGSLQGAYDFAKKAFNDPTGSFLTGNAPGTTLPAGSPTNSEAANGLFGNDFYPTLNSWSPQDSPQYHKIQMWNLADEKSRMLPGLEAQNLAQTAYNGMTDNGQVNGRMSADYSSPGFGQVTGDFGVGKLGTSSFGAQQPTGVPGTGAAPSTIWGAAPQRVRQWGI